MSYTIKDYMGVPTPTWCPGCGMYSIKATILQALVSLQIPPENLVIVHDIGCNGNNAGGIHAYTIKSLHGRAIPPAIGVKYANKDVKSIAIIGDGGNFWEGAAHWIATLQRNEDITILVYDNQIYGLTTGQTSPTTQKGYPTKTYPHGTVDEPINPITTSIAAGATFVARGWVGDPNGLKDVLVQAIKHKGVSIVDILTQCVTWNNSFNHYKEVTYNLDDSYDPSKKMDAYKIAEDYSKIALGVIYKKEAPTLEDKYPVLQGKPLVHRIPDTNIEDLLEEFT